MDFRCEKFTNGWAYAGTAGPAATYMAFSNKGSRFRESPEPFEIIHHHGNRDAVPRTLWKKGQRITCLDVIPADGQERNRSQLLISTGTVVNNMKVPPSGGCVVSVKVKFDDGHEVLS